MTANWNKLNKEFDDLFDKLTDEDWNNWTSHRESKKALRREVLNLKARIQSIMLELKNKSEEFSCNINFETKANLIEDESKAILDFNTKRRIAKISTDDYTPPIAA